MNEHNWLSDRTKTIIVTVTMALLLGSVLFGYYKLSTYKSEREAAKTEQIQNDKIN